MIRLAMIVAAAAVLLPFAAQAEPGKLGVELNKLEQGKDLCRAYIVVKNDLPESFTSLKLDLVMFDTDGIVARRFAVETAPLSTGKTALKVFDIADQNCDGIGRILLNTALTCRAADGDRNDCLERIEPSSRTGIDFIK